MISFFEKYREKDCKDILVRQPKFHDLLNMARKSGMLASYLSDVSIPVAGVSPKTGPGSLGGVASTNAVVPGSSVSLGQSFAKKGLVQASASTTSLSAALPPSAASSSVHPSISSSSMPSSSGFAGMGGSTPGQANSFHLQARQVQQLGMQQMQMLQAMQAMQQQSFANSSLPQQMVLQAQFGQRAGVPNRGMSSPKGGSTSKTTPS